MVSQFLPYLSGRKSRSTQRCNFITRRSRTITSPTRSKGFNCIFDNLAKTNQLIYTTHSPFLVDTSNIDRAKVVYSDENGLTVVSSDLRAANDKLNEKSIYAVHAALGLSVSDILLQGCQPIIVEGPSDQHYFNAIKLYLIRNKKYAPNMELVFMPSGGVRGVAGVVSIVSGKDGELPLVILDADGSGKVQRKNSNQVCISIVRMQ